MISIDLYQEIASLFRFRLDPAILGILTERPYRFRELARVLEREVRDHVDDNTFNRALSRLQCARYIVVSNVLVGRREVKAYTITDAGRRQVQMFEALGAVYQRFGIRPGDSPAV